MIISEKNKFENSDGRFHLSVGCFHLSVGCFQSLAPEIGHLFL